MDNAIHSYVFTHLDEDDIRFLKNDCTWHLCSPTREMNVYEVPEGAYFRLEDNREYRELINE